MVGWEPGWLGDVLMTWTGAGSGEREIMEGILGNVGKLDSNENGDVIGLVGNLCQDGRCFGNGLEIMD